MKTTVSARVVIAMAAIILCSADFTVAGPCDDDPSGCAAPRSWSEDFTVDPFVASPGDWKSRGLALPVYSGGKAILDGAATALSPWTLIDSADHFFQGTTNIHIIMDANPGIANDKGAGWWINADNNNADGGLFPINGILRRDSDGNQFYHFGFGGANEGIYLEFPVAEGGIDLTVELVPGAALNQMSVTYSLTDAVETHAGSFLIDGQQGGGSEVNQKWLTLFSWATGKGIIDFVEVINQPSTFDPGDFDADTDVDGADFLLWQQGGSPNGATSSDLAEWEGNFGAGGSLSAVAAAAVPEPASAMLALLGLGLFTAVQRREYRDI